MGYRVEICGNIASGKTTLCQKFQGRKFLPIFEEFQKNPFYEDFYQNPLAYSFETELTFLLQHYHSIKKKHSVNHLACDYSLIQDMAYADVNLAGNRHKIFFELVDEIEKEIGDPTQIIHLICSEEILIKRIRARNREVEASISIEYLQSLAKAIQMRVEKVSSQVKIITINSAIVDFTVGIEHIPSLKIQ